MMEDCEVVTHADFVRGVAKRAEDLPVDPTLEPHWAKVVLIDSLGGLDIQIVGIAEFDLTIISVECVINLITSHEIDWRPPVFHRMLTAITLCPHADKAGCAVPTLYLFVLSSGMKAHYSSNLPAIQAAGPKSAKRLANAVAYVDGKPLSPNSVPKAGQCSTIASCISIPSQAHEELQFFAFNLNLDVTTVLPGGAKVCTPFIIDPVVGFPPEPPSGAGEGP